MHEEVARWQIHGNSANAIIILIKCIKYNTHTLFMSANRYLPLNELLDL